MAQAMLNLKFLVRRCELLTQHVKLITQNFPAQSCAIRHQLYALILNERRITLKSEEWIEARH